MKSLPMIIIEWMNEGVDELLNWVKQYRHVHEPLSGWIGGWMEGWMRSMRDPINFCVDH
jgi:hypothetical protein